MKLIRFRFSYSDIRIRILEEYSYLCLHNSSDINVSELISDSKTLCQFILDPSSFNLMKRIHLNDPQVSRDLCFSINERGIKLLKEKEAK